MTIDERIEALTMNLELTSNQTHELTDWARQNIGELTAAMTRMADAMAYMAKTVTEHERRIQNLESGRA